jgi:hypothetical protein
MRTDLQIQKIDESDWSFNIEFWNDSIENTELPVDAIKRSGDRIGLRFFVKGTDIEPVDFMLVSPRQVSRVICLGPGQRTKVSFKGHLEEKLPGVAAISFAHATYRVELGKVYQVRFVWHDMQSDIVEWRAK